MKERCHRCYTILTSEDKHFRGDICEECKCDQCWEDAEHNQLIKSAHYKWRAVCFAMRWVWFSAAGYRSLRLHLMPRSVATARPKRTNGSGR